MAAAAAAVVLLLLLLLLLAVTSEEFVIVVDGAVEVAVVRNAAEEATADNTASIPPGLILGRADDTGLPSPVPVETYPSRLTKT